MAKRQSSKIAPSNLQDTVVATAMRVNRLATRIALMETEFTKNFAALAEQLRDLLKEVRESAKIPEAKAFNDCVRFVTEAINAFRQELTRSKVADGTEQVLARLDKIQDHVANCHNGTNLLLDRMDKLLARSNGKAEDRLEKIRELLDPDIAD